MRSPVLQEPFVAPTSSANHRVGTLIFLTAGVMFFAGLVGAYLVLRYGGTAWPPPGMPRLPVVFAGFNTVVIALSSLAMHRAVRARNNLDVVGMRRGLAIAASLGTAFLLLQMLQWSQLLSGGLGFSATTYGSIFYVLTGAHAVHAAGGVLWLLTLSLSQRESWVSDNRTRQVTACALYWHFVGLVWVGLYVVVYLL